MLRLLKEHFLDMVYVRNIIVVTLKKEICIILSRYNLKICNMRGQGYDGMNNMNGVWNRLQGPHHPFRDYLYAYHVHYFVRSSCCR